MQSFQTKIDERRQIYLQLSAEIERQLREAYHDAFVERGVNQSELARRLGINRSTVHHRLTGQVNMTIETIADMVWALDRAIRVEIYNPAADHQINRPQSLASAPASALTNATKQLLKASSNVTAASPVLGKPLSFGAAA